MKIYFYKNNIEKDWYYFYPSDRVFNLEFVYLVRSTLQEKFKSIIFKNTKIHADSIYFRFKDKADESFFLVWSNDGIELE